MMNSLLLVIGNTHKFDLIYSFIQAFKKFFLYVGFMSLIYYQSRLSFLNKNKKYNVFLNFFILVVNCKVQYIK